MACPVLKKSQLLHFSRIKNILKTWPVYMDTSPTGAGKTYITCALAKELGLSIVIICPKIMISKWKEVATSYGIKHIEALNYEAIRGTVRSKPKTPYLMRNDDVFYTTDQYYNLMKTGVLIVFDETHKAKNTSMQSEACISLVSNLITYNTHNPTSKSRVALLSATPADNMTNSVPLVRLLGITTKRSMYKYISHGKRGGEYIATGLLDIQKWCMERDHLNSNAIFKRRLTNKSISKIVYNALKSIIILKLASAAHLPVKSIVNDAKNGFYKLDSVNNNKLTSAIAKIRSSIIVGTEKIYVNYGALTTALMQSEKAKRDVVIRLAKEVLQSNPNAQVILYFNYLENIRYAMNALSTYNPLEMTGKDTIAQRDFVINSFQQNNDKYRLLISNPRVGSIGIDLDDKYGSRPRYMFLIPDYRLTDLYQAMGRIFRLSTKSNTTIRFIYGAGAKNELALLTSLSKKSTIIKNMIKTNNKTNLPGELPIYNE